MSQSEEVLQGLLDINAIIVNIEKPFIWASGIKSPIYCDNRKTIGHFQLRKKIANALTSIIKEKYKKVDLIGGTATAGIPHATSVADQLELPLVYFRSKPKDHGTNSVIEGDFSKGQKIVIIEDLISTGGSVLQCVNYAREAGLEVLGVVGIFSYELEKGKELFAKADISFTTIAGFSELANLLIEKNKLTLEQKEFLAEWKKNPQNSGIWD